MDEPARRRSARSHQAVLAATVELLEERGYRDLTVEAVARRAGVGKQTIYRWWQGSKPRLVLEAFASVGEEWAQPIDSGDVREDLLAVLRLVLALQRHGASGTALANRTLMAEAQLDPAFAAEYSGLHAGWNAPLVKAVQRGIDRGELRAGTDPELVVDLLIGAAWYRLLLQHAPLDEDVAVALVDAVLSGCQA